jgi:hypothetical protein
MNNELKPIDVLLPYDKIEESSNHKDCEEEVQQIPTNFFAFISGESFM